MEDSSLDAIDGPLQPCTLVISSILIFLQLSFCLVTLKLKVDVYLNLLCSISTARPFVFSRSIFLY